MAHYQTWLSCPHRNDKYVLVIFTGWHVHIKFTFRLGDTLGPHLLLIAPEAVGCHDHEHMALRCIKDVRECIHPPGHGALGSRCCAPLPTDGYRLGYGEFA